MHRIGKTCIIKQGKKHLGVSNIFADKRRKSFRIIIDRCISQKHGIENVYNIIYALGYIKNGLFASFKMFPISR